MGIHLSTKPSNEDVPWVPLKVNYFSLYDDHDKIFNFISRLVNANCPANLKPSDFGSETRPVWQHGLTKKKRKLGKNFWVERMPMSRQIVQSTEYFSEAVLLKRSTKGAVSSSFFRALCTATSID